jgi:hypothetical protein
VGVDGLEQPSYHKNPSTTRSVEWDAYNPDFYLYGKYSILKYYYLYLEENGFKSRLKIKIKNLQREQVEFRRRL